MLHAKNPEQKKLRYLENVCDYSPNLEFNSLLYYDNVAFGEFSISRIDNKTKFFLHHVKLLNKNTKYNK